MQSIWIHFGSGALGLGLVIPQVSKNKSIDVYLCNRRGDSSEESYQRNELLRSDREYLQRVPGYIYEPYIDTTIEIKDFLYFDELEKISSVISEHRPLFITTALKEYGVRESYKFLVQIFEIRKKSSNYFPAIFIACENAISSNKIKSEISSIFSVKFTDNIMFLDSVVDKLCNKPLIIEDKVVAVTEIASSWIIDKRSLWNLSSKDYKDIFEVIDSIDNVSSEYDIDFFVRRKKWLVNSMHQLIALYAHDAGYIRIDTFVNSSDGHKVLVGLATEIERIYLYNEKVTQSRKDVSDYISSITDRFIYFPSHTETALTRFTDITKLTGFYEDFYRKIGEPTEVFMQDTNEALFWIPYILLKTARNIAKGNYVKK